MKKEKTIHNEKISENLGDIGLISRNKRLEQELEIERGRLAACGVAALGYFIDCEQKYKSNSLDNVIQLKQNYDDLSEKYNELLYAVSQKFPYETRHETALRYILQRENSCSSESPQSI